VASLCQRADCGLRAPEVPEGPVLDQVPQGDLGVGIFDRATIRLVPFASALDMPAASPAALAHHAWIAAAIASARRVSRPCPVQPEICGYQRQQTRIILERLTYRGLSVAAAIVH